MPSRPQAPPVRSPLEKLHRRAARIALYGSLALVVVCLSAVAALLPRLYQDVAEDLEARQAAWANVDWAAKPEVQLFQRYLQIDTNLRGGNELAGAHFLAEVLAQEGIEAHIESLSHNKANLWAILEGESREALVLHHHMDTEPVRFPERWVHGPWSGHIEAPWIYGRGAFDMKSLAIAQLWAFLELKRSGVPLRRSVIFLATGSEEVGSDLGTRWVLAQHPELVERFWAVLTEGGVVEAVDQGAGKYWGIEVGQKRFVDLVVCSSNERQIQTLARLLRQRARRDRTLVGLAVPDSVAAFLPTYATTRHSEELRTLMADPQAAVEDLSRFRRLPPYIQAMMRPEFHPFPVQRVGDSWQFVIKLHLRPRDEVEEVRRLLLPDHLFHGVDTVILERPSARTGSPVDHPVVLRAQDVVQDAYPDITTGPYFLPMTATDSRYFRHAGIPSYGFSPFFLLTTDTLTGSQPNERVALPAYVDGVELYRRLVRSLVARSP